MAVSPRGEKRRPGLPEASDAKAKCSKGAEEVVGPRRRKPQLEQERVIVSDELQLVWYRPSMEEVDRQAKDPDTVRIFLNGCFDLMHVGHFNALRQAKIAFYQKGYKRVVMIGGLHSDGAIAGAKSAPMLSEEERLPVLEATKWVDEMATDLAYVSMSVKMCELLRIDYICHGDDLTKVASGEGMYSEAMRVDKFHMLKRTEGISTTYIVQRLLRQQAGDEGSPAAKTAVIDRTMATTQRLAQFAAPADVGELPRSLTEAKRVVYVPGVFDLLHAGQVAVLEEASMRGDFLLVGLHSDEEVRRHSGEEPVLTLLERAMAVLSMRCVDDILLDAPWEVSEDLLKTIRASLVVTGRSPGSSAEHAAQKKARLAAAESQGMLIEVTSSSELSAARLKGRFLDRLEQFKQRNVALMKKELAYAQNKDYVPEV